MADFPAIAEPLIAGSLYSCALAALAALLPQSASSPEAAFLREHGISPTQRNPLPQMLSLSRRQPHPGDEALLELGIELNLAPVELLAVTLAAAVEMDLMCGRAVAHLQAPIGGARPALGLLASAFSQLDAHVVENLLTGAAVGSGLLQILHEGAPLSERAISVPLPLCLALNGRDAAWPAAMLGLEGVPDTPLPPSVLREAERHASALAAGSRNVLVVRSASMAESRTVAQEIATVLNRRPLYLDMERAVGNNMTPVLNGLAPFLLLRGLLPVFCFDPGPAERRIVPTLPYFPGPSLALCGVDGSVETRGETPSAWRIAVPARAERQQLWQLALGDNSLASHLAADYRHGSGRIAQLGRLANQRCFLDEREEPTLSDVADAAWTGQGSQLESLAQPLSDRIPNEALVASPALREELSRLLLRCRRRESLIEGLGVSATARYHPGVRVLFTGPSGTGKTLAAGWLATQLGLPLYRADLASLTSKYIGETEKNLAQLLSRAEEAGILLLFDEADSLFGKRTEVKESNDRFANAQTNYLLQRIETFDGIALLTSNSRARFDPAFCRRLDMIIEFALPGPEERRKIWLSHLGEQHCISNKDLNQLAASADIAGGHIRNAVLTAAVLAQVKSHPIEYQDVLVGLTDEYRKLNRQLPPELYRNT